MKLMQKGNRQLRVADERADDMIKSGYVEIDQKTGKPVRVEPKPDDKEAVIKSLEAENAELKKENLSLKDRVNELTVQLETGGKSK
jgi:major membrane immunogen (membrane-anchored lipoprotein)